MGKSYYELKEEITTLISFYEAFIQHQNRMGRFDINTDCEEIFRRVLGALHGVEFKNLNDEKLNHEAIDLGNKRISVCYQITSTFSKQKILDTINTFYNNDFDREYRYLTVLILQSFNSEGNKKFKRVKKSVESGQFSGNTKVEVIDLHGLLKEILLRKDVEIMGQIWLALKEYVIRYLDSARLLVLHQEKFQPKLPANCVALMKYIGNTGDSEDVIYQEIENLARRLAGLDASARVLIGVAVRTRLKNRKSSAFCIERVTVNYEALARRFLDRNECYEILHYLEQMNCFSTLEDNEYDYHLGEFTFPDKENNYDVLLMVVDFCEHHGIDIENILTKLDFSCLERSGK